MKKNKFDYNDKTQRVGENFKSKKQFKSLKPLLNLKKDLSTLETDEKFDKEIVEKNKLELSNINDSQLITKLKKENHELREKNFNLIKSNDNLKIDLNKNIVNFQSKVKSLALEAQEKLNVKEIEMIQKFDLKKAEIKKYANENIIIEIFDPLLTMEIVANSHNSNPEIKSYVNGFKMIINQIFGVLNDHNFELINPQIGEEFNPEIHYLFNKSNNNNNKITKVLKKGLKLFNRILIPAKVEI